MPLVCGWEVPQTVNIAYRFKFCNICFPVFSCLNLAVICLQFPDNPFNFRVLFIVLPASR